MAYYNPYLQNGYLGQQNDYVNRNPIWVQGEAGAKSYMVPPNSTVMLMDSESQRFFLKSTDATGMPQPLRVFEYTEKPLNAPQAASNPQSVDLSGFVTKAEFDAFKSEIRRFTQHEQSSVSGTEQEPKG